MKKLFSLFFITLCFSISFAQNLDKKDRALLQNIEAFAKMSAVTGRENEAVDFIRNLFPNTNIQTDKLGNLILTIGSGSPKKLLVAPLDEPGYVVSNILENGYLQITTIGYGHIGNLYHQFLEGHEVQINTASGAVLGVSCVPSTHYDGLRAEPERRKSVFQWQEAFIDVGAESAEEVAKMGIRLLDPITLNKKPAVIDNQIIAAPSARIKAAAMALATVAKTLLKSPPKGTVVIAWTSLELLNGKGLEAILNQLGPFDEVYRFNRFLESEKCDKGSILLEKPTDEHLTNIEITTPVIGFRHPGTGNPNWGEAKIFNVGLPALYADTPVESVGVNDVNRLISFWLQAVGSTKNSETLPIAKQNIPGKNLSSHAEAAAVMSDLIGTYGVSTAEGPVRDYILKHLPAWAKPTVDEVGNIVLTFGNGKQHIAFVAHMDEVGFVVDSIAPDGKLFLDERGGFFKWLWEAQPAIMHVEGKEIPAIFEPRANYLQASKRNFSESLSVNAGFTSKEEAEAAGVIIGVTSVTMPKAMVRLSEERAAARGFDDRAGCAALLLSLRNMNPDALPFKVTFVWSVGEETGLVGSTFAAKQLQDVAIVYPIDTYVSSDAPQESPIFGNCPLGQGAVIRVLESINFVNRGLLQYLQQLAANQKIEVQYGMTVGGTDGQGFLSYGIPSVPLSWPGRYSHSPIEVMDFRDLDNLVKLIQTIINDKTKTY